ncbi:DNA gyrase subunit A [Microcystis sp. 0824]|nr:DNA gyrase subunit A [Microcystis sp. 0824]
MKKFSPPQMKEVSFPTPHTLHPLSSQETGENFQGKSQKKDSKVKICLFQVPYSLFPVPFSN